MISSDRPGRQRRGAWQQGSSMLETLLAVPLLLLLGLGIAQLTLIYQAKHALDYAVMQAARQGAVDHASPEAIRRGLAAGLVPYLYGADDWAELIAAEAGAHDHLTQGSEAGWILLRQRSPLRESFDDWAQPAIDEFGELIAGQREIPNDNLDSRRTRTHPRSGTSGYRLSEPIGSSSGQTLADANLLRLELVYGVRLVVPIIGRLFLRTLSGWHRCDAATLAPTGIGAPAGAGAEPGNGRLGLLLLGRPDGSGRNRVSPPGTDPAAPSGPAWMCPFYRARDSGEGRIPIRVSATVRMMSTARHPESAGGREQLAAGGDLERHRQDGATDETAPGSEPETGSGGAGSDNGTHSTGGNGTGGSPRVGASPAGGAPQTSLQNGFLGIGSDRPYPQRHPAVCAG